jgi:uncharacterized protein
VLIARKYNIEAIFVSSYNHFSPIMDVKWIYVDTEKEAADLYIMNNAGKNDIVVTADSGLASVLITRGVYVLSPRGKIYKEEEIANILEFRYLHAKQRRQGIYPKGLKRFSQEDLRAFIQSLEKILSKLAGNLT